MINHCVTLRILPLLLFLAYTSPLRSQIFPGSYTQMRTYFWNPYSNQWDADELYHLNRDTHDQPTLVYFWDIATPLPDSARFVYTYTSQGGPFAEYVYSEKAQNGWKDELRVSQEFDSLGNRERYSILEPNGPQWDTMVGSNYHLLQYNSSNLLDYDRQWIRTSAGAWEVHSIKRYHFNANQEWDTTFNTLYTNIVPVYNRAIYSSWHDFDERLPDEVEFARLVGLSWVPYSKEIFTYGVNDSYIQEVQIPDSNGTMQTLKIVESDKDSYGNVILHQVFLVANGDTTFQSGEKFLIQYGANGEQLEYINQTAGPDSVYVNVWKAEYGYNSVSLAPERVDWLGASLFPNPGTGKFNLAIDYPKSEELGVQVFDLQGKLLAEEHLFHPSGNFVHSLDLTGFPPATYLVRLTMDNRSANHKLVVH